MKKFEVGERVHFIYAGKLRTGSIKKITQGQGEIYAHIKVDDTQVCVRVTTDKIAKLDQPEPQSGKVKKINEIMLELINRKHMDILSDDDITQMLIEALNIVNTLDEPKPVVVPKETADFIETYDSSNDRYSVLATIMKDIIDCYSPDTDDFFTESLEKNIQAVLNGYVVEEEKKYYVRLPLFEDDEDASELVPRDKYLTINARSGESYLLSHRIALAGARSDSDWKSQLTEEQIKSEDERYWAFAVPVEEVEASE